MWRQGSVRRFMRGVQRSIRTNRIEESVLDSDWRDAGNEIIRTLFLQTVGFSMRWVSARLGLGQCWWQTAPAIRSREQGEGMAGRRRRAWRLGYQPRCAVFRDWNSGCAGQVFLRVARCAGRLPGDVEELFRQDRARFRRVHGWSDDRANSLHRQGYYLLPHVILAGDAEILRLQGAG